MDIFAKKLKDLRLEKNLNQSQIADLLGVTYFTVGKWENSKAEPSFDTLKKLAEFFDVSTDYLLGLEDDLGIKTYQQPPVPAGSGERAALSGEEADLLRDFRKLGIFARSSILIQVRALAEKAEKEDCKYGE